MKPTQTIPAIWLARVNATPGFVLTPMTYQEASFITRKVASLMIPLKQPLQRGNGEYEGLTLAPYAMRQRVEFLHFYGAEHPDGLYVQTQLGKVCMTPKVLGAFVAQFPRLRCVYLSGCATPELLDELLRRDVPAIMVTQSAQYGADTEEVAHTFYERIGAGDSIRDAFSVVKYQHETVRDYRVHYDIESDEMTWARRPAEGEPLPWGLYFLKEHGPLLNQGVHPRLSFSYSAASMKQSMKQVRMGIAVGLTAMAAVALALQWKAPEVLTLLASF